MDISRDIMMALMENNDRLKDFYSVGPVQRAAVEDFFLNIKDAIMEEVRQELVGEEYIKDCFDFEEEMFYAGNDTGVLDSLTRIEQFGIVNDDSQSTLPKQNYAIVETPGGKLLTLFPGDKMTISYPQVPLSDSQIMDMYCEPSTDKEMIAFAREIERAHGIGANDGKA